MMLLVYSAITTIHLLHPNQLFKKAIFCDAEQDAQTYADLKLHILQIVGLAATINVS